LGKEKTIILLGTGFSCRFCDFQKDAEIYGVNGAYRIIDMMPEKLKKHFRIDKLFMTDYMWSPEGRMCFDVDDMNEQIAKYGGTMFSMHELRLGKHRLNARRYPYHQIVKHFSGLGYEKGGEGADYFTDTITYMIAYALYKNTYLAQNEQGVVRLELSRPLKFRLFGVDMCTTVEYQVSKGGVEWWLGIARGLGCDIEVSYGSAILANPRGMPYGWRKKMDLSQVDPYNVLGKRKPPQKKKSLNLATGSEKIQAIMARSAQEGAYKDEAEGGEGVMPLHSTR